MIEFLKEYQELITLLFTIAVGISTIVYAYLTAKLVSETKLMRKSQTDPEISLSLVQNDHSISFIDLVIENIGLGPAYNINIEVVKDFKLSNRMLSEVGFIKNGIKYFSPRQSLKLWVASFIEDKELAEKSIELKITYTNSLNEQFTRQFILNFSQFSYFTQLGTPPLIKIAEHLETIDKTLNNITSGFKKLKVDIFDSDDREQHEKEVAKEFEEYKKSQNKKNST
ncbi:MAG: hypothetical protein Q8N83_02925 [Ignavibacteria bacterium]|nr:hypothetical protein [Ignavibacteria bacterium]